MIIRKKQITQLKIGKDYDQGICIQKHLKNI
jgi:hypothetical protein